MEVPDLVGLTVDQARTLLSGNSIELGAMIGLDAITGYRQCIIIAQQKPDLYSTLSTGEVVKIR